MNQEKFAISGEFSHALCVMIVNLGDHIKHSSRKAGCLNKLSVYL